MKKELQSLGFTPHEAAVYVAALANGPSSVQQLATAARINRITAHSIVEKFESQQIFQRSYFGKKRKVAAVNPSALLQLLSNRQQELERQQQTLQSILPKLAEAFYRSERGLQVLTFRGAEGYEQMCEDVLSCTGELLEYADIDQLTAVIGPYIAKDYLPRKHKRQIKTKFIFADSPGAREYIKKSYCDVPNAAPMEAKFINRAEFPTDAHFALYDDKLAVLTPRSLDGLIIQDQAVAAAFRVFFNFVWQKVPGGISN